MQKKKKFMNKRFQTKKKWQQSNLLLQITYRTSKKTSKKGKRKSPIKDQKKIKELYRRLFGPDKYPNNTEQPQPNKERKQTTT